MDLKKIHEFSFPLTGKIDLCNLLHIIAGNKIFNREVKRFLLCYSKIEK